MKNKIQSKHVDFVICYMHLNIKPYWNRMIGSHGKAERKAYVQFYIAWTNFVVYKVIHTRGVNADTLEFEDQA